MKGERMTAYLANGNSNSNPFILIVRPVLSGPYSTFSLRFDSRNHYFVDTLFTPDSFKFDSCF